MDRSAHCEPQQRTVKVAAATPPSLFPANSPPSQPPHLPTSLHSCEFLMSSQVLCFRATHCTRARTSLYLQTPLTVLWPCSLLNNRTDTSPHPDSPHLRSPLTLCGGDPCKKSRTGLLWRKTGFLTASLCLRGSPSTFPPMFGSRLKLMLMLISF